MNDQNTIMSLLVIQFDEDDDFDLHSNNFMCLFPHTVASQQTETIDGL